MYKAAKGINLFISVDNSRIGIKNLLCFRHDAEKKQKKKALKIKMEKKKKKTWQSFHVHLMAKLKYSSTYLCRLEKRKLLFSSVKNAKMSEIFSKHNIIVQFRTESMRNAENFSFLLFCCRLEFNLS